MAMNNWGGVKEHMTQKNRKFLAEKKASKKYPKGYELDRPWHELVNKKSLSKQEMISTGIKICIIVLLTVLLVKVIF